MLLAIASKNNIEDVQAIFSDNPHMVLKEKDFVLIKANWEPKYINIRDMANELNLGLDSFVFLDDNEVERESVRVNLPQVAVADFPRDVAKLPNAVRDIYEKYFGVPERQKRIRQKLASIVMRQTEKKSLRVLHRWMITSGR